MNFMSKFIRKILLFGLLILFVCGTVHSTNYKFAQADSVTFPTSVGLEDYEVYDVDNDGYDDLIAVFIRGYYIYSFHKGQMLYSDTTWYRAVAVGDVDNDMAGEICLLKEFYQSRSLYKQELPPEDPPEYAYSFEKHSELLEPDLVDLRIGDVDFDGKYEAVFSCTGNYLVYLSGDYSQYEYYDAGEIGCVQTGNWHTEWGRHGYLIPGMQHLELYDLDGDGTKEIITWGKYYHVWNYKVYGSPDYWNSGYDEFHDFGIYNYAGGNLLNIRHYEPVSVVCGDFSYLTNGDEVIIYRIGNSLDPSVFSPSGWYGIYCLNLNNGDINVSWGIDAGPAQYCLIALSSLPGTFCASDGSGQFTLYNGSDGSAIGTVNGLLKTANTADGHFADFPDDPIQAVQFSSNKAYLYVLESITGVEEDDHRIVPNDFALYQNQPNPFNPSTVIPFALSSRSNVTLSVYNLLGQKIADLVDQELPAGSYQIDWNGTDGAGRPVSSGVYFYLIKSGDHSLSKKMVLLK